MPIFLRHNKSIILIAGFALLLRIGFFMVVQPWDKQVLQETILVGDPDGYHNMALSIINSGSFSYHKYMPFEKIKGDVSAERTPGYPLFVSFVYFLFGVRPWLVILFQLLVNVGSLILIYVLAKKVFEKKIAIIAALLYAIEPHAISLPIALMIYRRNYNFLIVILFVFLYFVAVIGPLGIVRFKLPLTPFYIIVGASGIFEIFHFTRAYVGTALGTKKRKLDF